MGTHPCPCGYHGDPKRECRCSPLQIQRYRQRISGPLLDRIDLHIDVPLIDYKELSSNQPAEPSSSVRHRVRAARLVQEERFKDNPKVACNSSMQSRQLRQHCQLNDEGNAYLDQAMSDFHLSARAFDRILKVARTLADLEASTQIESSHVLESIQYRALDRNLWG